MSLEETSTSSSVEKGPYSTSSHLRLQMMEADSFAGLPVNEQDDASLVVMFPEENNYALIEGNQGTGKTSMLDCLKFIFTGDEPDNAINSITKDKKVKAIFVDRDGDKKYYIRLTKTGYSIDKVEIENGKEVKSTVKSPKNWLRDKIGPVGIDPSFIKRMSPEAQINWIRDLISLSEEDKKKEKEILSAVQSWRTKRKNFNLKVRGLRYDIVSSGLYGYDKTKKKVYETDKYKKSAEEYAIDISEKQAAVSKEFDEANQQNIKLSSLQSQLNDETNGYVVSIKRTLENISSIEDRIKQLQDQLTSSKNDLLLLEEKKKDTEVLITEMANVPNRLIDARLALENMNTYVLEKTGFDTFKATKEAYEVAFNDWQDADKMVDETESVLREFIVKITPDIEGVELCIPQDINIDEELQAYKEENENASEEELQNKKVELEKKKRAGIYYKGHFASELCESEIWGLCTHVWKMQKVPVIFIENITSLGTDAVATLNEFMSNGGKVYATRMNRELSKMKISFDDKIS